VGGLGGPMVRREGRQWRGHQQGWSYESNARWKIATKRRSIGLRHNLNDVPHRAVD